MRFGNCVCEKERPPAWQYHSGEDDGQPQCTNGRKTIKHAVVIGGTRGIGAGVTRTLLAGGWAVTATGVSSEETSAFEAGCTVPELKTAVLDVTDQSAVNSFFAGISQLSGLVNCAGILIREKEYEIETFQKVVDVNLTGTMRTCLAAHGALASVGGAVVNTASMLSYFGGALVPAYSASKGGVAQLTRSLAARWATDGIRVNAVAPRLDRNRDDGTTETGC